MKTSTTLIFTILFSLCALSVFALDAYETTLQPNGAKACSMNYV